MTRIEVSATPTRNGWDCTVTVRNGRETDHRVRVARGDLARLAPGASDPVRLVQASFAFLLEHEPKESILREFDLTVIGRYFPDYETEIAARLFGLVGRSRRREDANK